jgi:flagellar operon protein
LSAHAEKRLAERRIPFGDDVRNLLDTAMTELQAKGARDALILTDQGAFVVNVPTRTLVTAMNQDDLSGRIVTQIDSISIKTGS